MRVHHGGLGYRCRSHAITTISAIQIATLHLTHAWQRKNPQDPRIAQRNPDAAHPCLSPAFPGPLRPDPCCRTGTSPLPPAPRRSLLRSVPSRSSGALPRAITVTFAAPCKARLSAARSASACPVDPSSSRHRRCHKLAIKGLGSARLLRSLVASCFGTWLSEPSVDHAVLYSSFGRSAHACCERRYSCVWLAQTAFRRRAGGWRG